MKKPKNAIEEMEKSMTPTIRIITRVRKVDSSLYQEAGALDSALSLAHRCEIWLNLDLGCGNGRRDPLRLLSRGPETGGAGSVIHGLFEQPRELEPEESRLDGCVFCRMWRSHNGFEAKGACLLHEQEVRSWMTCDSRRT